MFPCDWKVIIVAIFAIYYTSLTRIPSMVFFCSTPFHFYSSLIPIVPVQQRCRFFLHSLSNGRETWHENKKNPYRTCFKRCGAGVMRVLSVKYVVYRTQNAVVYFLFLHYANVYSVYTGYGVHQAVPVYTKHNFQFCVDAPKGSQATIGTIIIVIIIIAIAIAIHSATCTYCAYFAFLLRIVFLRHRQ